MVALKLLLMLVAFVEYDTLMESLISPIVVPKDNGQTVFLPSQLNRISKRSKAGSETYSGDVLRKINNHCFTIKTEIKEPVGKHFNLSSHK